MTSRRQLLLGVAASLPLAGCLGSVDSDSNQNQVIKTELDPSEVSAGENKNDAGTDSETESDPKPKQKNTDPLPGFEVHNVGLTYYKHLGLYTLIQIENTSKDARFEIKTEAYNPNGLIAETERWESIPSTITRAIEIQMDDIWEFRNNINNIDSFVIKGRTADNKFGVIKKFTSGSFQNKLANETLSFEKPEDNKESSNTKPEVDVSSS